ncbi:MAG: HAMP domain-containing histidine kinase [Thermoplasmatales archaeon]|nr:HAMP domain-containing histidine kinase [Thermoplasmatales archaeon]
MRNFLSIKIKLILPLLLILVIVFSVSSLVIIQREYASAKESLIRGSESYASLSVSDIIRNFDIYYESGFYKFIEIIDETLTLNDNIIKTQIVNVNGIILFDSDEINDGKYDDEINQVRYLENPDLISKAGLSIPSIGEIEEETNSFNIMQPYIEEWGRHDYSVRFIVSLNNLNEMTIEMYTTVIIYSSGFTLISFFLILFLISQFITSPIGKLRKGVIKMRDGDLGFKVKINSKDEIGDLANTFNIMSKDLKKSRIELEDYSKNLEIQVGDRTKELHDKSKNLELTNKELKKAQNKLNEMNKYLEEKVMERTLEVETLLKQKNDFINQLGHDLKTPLGPLINLIPLLKKKEQNPKKKEILDVLHQDVEYMKNLVVNTLELARLNSPKTKFSFEKINLKKDIEKIINNKKIIFDKKKILIENKINHDHYVIVDKQEFEVLITNLIDNSVKYNNENGKIILKSKEENNFITISIIDTGIGLDNKQIKNIFDEFYKADQSRHDIESSGLGLSICKRIVEKHNGKIWAESTGLGKGSIFYISLPKDKN